MTSILLFGCLIDVTVFSQNFAITTNFSCTVFFISGFAVVKDLSVEVEKDTAPSKSTSTSIWSDKTSTDGISPVAPISHLYSTDEKHSSSGGRITENESVYAQSENGSVQSPPGSSGRSTFETPSHEFHAARYDIHDISPRAKDNHRLFPYHLSPHTVIIFISNHNNTYKKGK